MTDLVEWSEDVSNWSNDVPTCPKSLLFSNKKGKWLFVCEG